MMENEPPDHTRLRSLVAKAFARGHVERLRPRVQPTRRRSCWTPSTRRGSTCIADYAEPLPVAVIADLLGVPESDRQLLRPWSAGIVAMYEYGRTDDDGCRRGDRGGRVLGVHARAGARRRRRDPRDDLVSHLVAAEEDGQRLTADELVASAILLLNAGHEASVNAFGNGVVALLAHPEQLARVRAADGPEVVEPPSRR